MPAHPNIPRSLYAAMAIQFAVGGTIMPFVSIILRDRGLSFEQMGAVFFASSSTLLVFPFLWGMLADRIVPINRLFTLLNALAIGALALFSVQRTFWGLLICFTAFYACFHPTLTLINALSFRHMTDPRAHFGRLRSWGSIGWMVPSLPIYLWLARVKAVEPAQAFALDFVLYGGIALSVVMVFLTFSLPHTPPVKHDSEHADRIAYWPAMRGLFADPNYLTILGSFFLVAASFSIYVFYSPPHLEDLGVDRSWIGPIQCIGVLLEVILFRWQPNFIRRWSYHTSMLVGCLLLLTRQVIFSLSTEIWLLCLSYLLPGAVIVFYHISVSVLVNALARAEVRATAQTLLVFFGSGMGPMFANWFGGHLAARAPQNLQHVFIFSSILAGLAALLVAMRGSKLDAHTKIT